MKDVNVHLLYWMLLYIHCGRFLGCYSSSYSSNLNFESELKTLPDVFFLKHWAVIGNQWSYSPVYIFLPKSIRYLRLKWHIVTLNVIREFIREAFSSWVLISFNFQIESPIHHINHFDEHQRVNLEIYEIPTLLISGFNSLLSFTGNDYFLLWYYPCRDLLIF